MTNIKKILGLLGLAARARNVTFGADSTIEAIEKGKVELLIIAEDASDRTKKKFEGSAEKYSIPIIICGTIEEISQAVGKDNKAIIGIKDRNIAVEVEKINRGDVNG